MSHGLRNREVMSQNLSRPESAAVIVYYEFRSNFRSGETMKRFVLVLLTISTSVGWCQLTSDQKNADFQNLVSLYSKQYGPTHWKTQAFGYTLYKLGPWLTKVQGATDDISFYEVMSEYVAAL